MRATLAFLSAASFLVATAVRRSLPSGAPALDGVGDRARRSARRPRSHSPSRWYAGVGLSSLFGSYGPVR